MLGTKESVNDNEDGKRRRGVRRIEHRMDGAEVGFVIFIFCLAIFMGVLLGVVLLFQMD